LGFILLAAATWALSRAEKQQLPWKWLCLFGLAHGINEWLDMVAFSLSDSPAFSVVRLIIMAASFLFLIEFGRAGTEAIHGKSPKRWVFIPLLSLAGLGALFGMSGLNAAARYTLGLTGGIWAALALWQHRRAAHPGSRPLFIAALSMGLYGVAAGVVVPHAPFFPASLINHASFFAFTGFPIQLLRGCLACMAAGAVWQYRGAWRGTAFNAVISPAAFRYEGWTIAAITAILAAGWIMTCFFGGFGQQRDEEHYRHDLNILRRTLEVSAETVDRLVKTMAGSPNLGVMGVPGTRDLVAIDETLDRYAGVVPDSICYLLDSNGTTLASSNRDTPSSFVGQSYAVRPYFKKAMQGSQGSYVAVGLTSKAPGYYTSYPVRDAAGGIVGVAVVKLNLDKLFIDAFHEEYSFLVDPNGIILSSTGPDFLLRSLRPISEEVRRGLTRSQQFPALPEPPVLPPDSAPEKLFTFHGKYLQSFEETTSVEGLSLVVLGSMGSWKMARLMSILITLLAAVLTVVFLVTQESSSEASAQITTSELLYRTLVEGSPNWVGLFDRDGRCVAVNQNGLKAMGLTDPEVHGKSFLDIWSQESAPTIEHSVSLVLHGERVSFEVDRFLPDGSSMTWYVVLNPVCEHDETVSAFVGIATDISTRKRAEAERTRLEQRLRQVEKTESLGRMAGSVAHHFNNMLAVVMGNLEMAMDDLPRELDVRVCIAEAMKAAEHAAEIGGLLLAYLGQSRGRKEPLDLARFIREIRPLLDASIPRSIHLRTELPDRGPIIQGDAVHMKQILTNLVSNAVEAMEESEGNITVRVRVAAASEIQGLRFFPLDWEPKAKEYACLSISDTGSGMDVATREKVFDPFFSTRFTGRGLGLPVVLGLVGAHDGAIAVESRPGWGAVFQVFLPIHTQARRTFMELHGPCPAYLTPNARDEGGVLR
jgi:PAS domain S-box-containing protein